MVKVNFEPGSGAMSHQGLCPKGHQARNRVAENYGEDLEVPRHRVWEAQHVIEGVSQLSSYLSVF